MAKVAIPYLHIIVVLVFPIKESHGLFCLAKHKYIVQVSDLKYIILWPHLISIPRYMVAINFGPHASSENYRDAHYMVPGRAEVVMTTRPDMSVEVGDNANLADLHLEPGDGVIVRWAYSR